MRKPVTIQYPTQHRKVPERDRAFPILLYDFGIDEPFCTGCHACERACPVECMTVTMKDNPKFAEGKSKRRKIIDEFFIDYGRCMRCNICVEVCNFDAIAMNNTWTGPRAFDPGPQGPGLDRDQLMALSKTQQIGPGCPPNPMTIAELVFYLLAVVAIGAGIGTVTVPNVVHAALFLIVSLVCTAGFYILLSSEFLALVQILVYGGAVATIILFGLMLTRGGRNPARASSPGKPMAAAGVGRALSWSAAMRPCSTRTGRATSAR